MTRFVLTVLAVALSLAVVVDADQLAPDPTRPSYDEFMRLSADERESRILQMGLAGRLALRRIHAQRWLDKNRASLRASQVAVVQEAIDFISPERYDAPYDPELAKQEADIAHRLACALGEQRALAAFTFRDEPSQGNRTWSNLLDTWAQWLVECVTG